MNYRHYSSEDFALDKNFQQWVLAPGPADEHFWQDFIHAHPTKSKVVAEAIELVHLAGLSTDHEANTQFLDVWNTLKTEVNTTRQPLWTRHTFRYAAVLAGFCILAALIWNTLYHPSRTTEYKTAYNETKRVLLPDGSTVRLNANSRLQMIAANWSEKEAREVILDGEAYFEITKTKDSKPFIVKTSDQVDIQVLGTEFNVNTRRANTHVFLRSGSVRIHSPTKKVKLKPGELAVYNKHNKEIKVGPSNGEAWLAWTDNLFVFDDAYLVEVARAIEDHFGVKVTITSEMLARQRFTGKIPRSDLDNLLNVISETLKINITSQHQEIIMQP